MVLLLLLQTGYTQLDTTRLNSLLEKEKVHFGGKLVILVWKDSVVYQKGTGEHTITTQGPLGCSSAWLTAALTMTFVDQGKIALEDKVSKYLPVYALYAKKYLTIRQCLANTTGLAIEKGGLEKLFQRTKFETLEDEVNSFASGREIVHNPGEAFSYNAIGTNIAGRILEIVGKKSFDRLMVERIFRPLTMKKSSFGSEKAINPFSGAISTPSDYMKFLQMLLNKGMANGKQVLSEQSVAELLKVQTGNAIMETLPKEMQGYSYGLGNWIQGGYLFTCPGLSANWPYINLAKKYACILFGEVKDRNKKDGFSAIIQELEAKM